jgi:integrase
MSTLPVPQPSLSRHASEAEYLAFVERYYPNEGTRNFYRKNRALFVHTYPDLAEWFAAPLADRVGRRHGMAQGHCTHRASYEARQYLFYLAMRGYITLDWEWLIALPKIHLHHMLTETGLAAGVAQLIREAELLGYHPVTSSEDMRWALSRIFLHTGFQPIEQLTEVQCTGLAQAIRHFGLRSDVTDFYTSVDHYHQEARKSYLTALHMLHVVLYHRGQAKMEPRRIMPLYAERGGGQPRMQAVVDRYLTARRLTDRPGTVAKLDLTLRRCMKWLAATHAEITSWAQVTRDQVLAFAEVLDTMPNATTGQPLSTLTKRGTMSNLSVFFRDVSSWGWEDVPERPLLGIGDIPKIPERVPRYIPEDELTRLMEAVRALPCPYQRGALLIARWSGARRGEIRRLEVNCLDQYPDGTPRLRLPAGKMKRERIIPLHQEAAEAIRALQSLRHAEERGFRDTLTGVETRYLFLNHGKLYSTYYLFDCALSQACSAAGLVDRSGKPMITAHRFRHTVGTQLAERGAKLHTIMKVLGHTSASMTMTYAQISDREVLKDYQTVLGPGATIAGPFAETLKSGQLPTSSVAWLTENFFKTELELGRCLRLPQEGPCECDLYLSCAKFVTSSEYAPRLRRRHKREQELVEDAVAHGWQREVERHQCTVRRIEQLLEDLGEPLDGPKAED